MGGIQSAVDRKKRERSDERLRNEGLDPERDMREDRPIPMDLTGATGTNYFLKLTPEHIIKHKDDKFSIDGRKRMSYMERLNLPSYSPDSVRTLGGPEAWQKAKELLKNIYKGDTDALGEMFDQATKRGGYIQKKVNGGSVWDDNMREATALGGRNPNPWLFKNYGRGGF